MQRLGRTFLVAMIAGAIALGAFLYLRPSGAGKDTTGVPEQSLAVAQPELKILEAGEEAFQTLPAGKSGEPVVYRRQETPGTLFTGFHEWSRRQQETFATELMARKDLDPEEIAFIRSELRNKDLTDLTRNNLANAVLSQDQRDPELYRLFLAMIDDPEQSDVWRDYSLQFLSRTLRFSSDRDVIVSKLKDVARHGRGYVQGTAVVHLAMHEADGRLQLGEEFSGQVARTLKDETVDLSTKTSLLGVIGQRKDKANLELVREFAAKAGSDDLKRTAIASLGLMGDESDLPVVKKALDHKNRAVKLAARGALKRLNRKLAVSTETSVGLQ